MEYQFHNNKFMGFLKKLVLALLLFCCVWFFSAFRIDLPGTTSGLTMKLTQLTMTNMQLGK